MKMRYISSIAAVLALCFSACDSSSSDNNGTGSGGSTAKKGSAGQKSTGSAGGKATKGTGGSGSVQTGTGDFDSCIASLSSCRYDDNEKACSDQTLLPVPLTAGGNYGPITMKAGPYGAYVEWNYGENFKTEVNALESVCVPTGIESFMEPQSLNVEIENLHGMDHALYTVFRPACFKDGEKYPVITWANGTCGETGGYGGLLSMLASNGFVIFASNSTWTGTAPTDTVQLRALDLAKAENEDPASIFYQRLDLDKVGAMGHSQGAAATATAASDPRIKAIILWNGGTSNAKPFLDVSADRDVGGTNTPMSMATAVNGATQPGAWVYFHQVLETGGNSTGHLVLMEQPDRVIDLAVAWWKYILNGDTDAGKMFLGSGCGLCNKADQFEYGDNSMLK